MKGWQDYKFNEFVEINPTIVFDRQKEYPFIEMKDVDGTNKFCQSHQKRLFSGAPRFYNNDTLFARITPCLENGKIAKVRNLDGGVGFGSTEFLVFHSRDNLSCNDFIYYLARWDEVRDFAEKNMEGTSGRQRVNKEAFSNLELKLPLLPEQRAISSVLSSLDDKIDFLHRQNATLESLAETLFRQWFVVEAKEEWEICQLGDILDTVESGSRPKGGIDPNLQMGIASIGAESINGIGKYDFSKTKFVTQEFYDQMKRGKIKDYDVLIYKDGAYIGKKGMFALGYPFSECAINEHVFILRANEKASQSFLYFLLQKDEIEALNSNAAQPGINQDALKSLEIILPSKNEIDKFDIIVLPWMNKIFVNALQIRTLEKLRDSLLPKLMSGEVRVKY